MQGIGKTVLRTLVILLAFGLFVGFAAGTAQAKLKPELDVVKSAKVTKVAYEVKKYKGKDRFHVTVELKNVTQDPKRYRVNIWLPDGVSGGGFFPRKKKSIAPGKTLSRTFPMYYDKVPSEMTILVKELPVD